MPAKQITLKIIMSKTKKWIYYYLYIYKSQTFLISIEWDEMIYGSLYLLLDMNSDKWNLGPLCKRYGNVATYTKLSFSSIQTWPGGGYAFLKIWHVHF